MLDWAGFELVPFRRVDLGGLDRRRDRRSFRRSPRSDRRSIFSVVPNSKTSSCPHGLCPCGNSNAFGNGFLTAHRPHCRWCYASHSTQFLLAYAQGLIGSMDQLEISFIS